MSESLKNAVRMAVLRLLEPLARLLLETGIGVGEFIALAKLAYVRAAREQGRESAGELERPNVSRIAVVTGLTRVEVAAILAAEHGAAFGSERGRQRAERVLSGWWNDADFQTEVGLPAVLPVKGARRSFAALCHRYSGERRAGRILEELLRVGAVRRQADGRVQAVSRTYATVRWNPDGIEAVGTHLGEHCATLLHNLKHPSRPRFVRRIVNTHLDPVQAPMLTRFVEEQATTFVNTVDDALNDRQYTVTNRKRDAESMRLGIAVYVFEEPSGDAAVSTVDAAAPPSRGSARKSPRRQAKDS